jgi:predicted nucleic acid-binding protein
MSPVTEFELSLYSAEEKSELAQLLYSVAREKIDLSDKTIERAKVLTDSGLPPLDSLHLALAESGGADMFLTTNAFLLKSLKNINVAVSVSNPVIFLTEVLTSEH